MRRLLLSAAAVTAVAVTALASPSSGAPAPARLAFGPNTYAYVTSYGEPGIAIAPDGTVYATTPGEDGVVLGRSDDKGKTWKKLPTAVSDATQAAVKGGDSDVVVAKDGTVYAADLNVDGITVFRSTDRGEHFPQQAFINSTSDREWLAVTGPHGENVYVVWHEIATGTMLAAVSHDSAKTFGVPQVLYSNAATTAESVHDGTAIGGVSTDSAGRVFVTYATSRLTTTDTTYGTPPVDSIHISVLEPESTTWHDYPVNPGADDANFGNFWMASAVDRGDHVYAVYSGYAHKGEPMHVWLQTSTDHGRTWTTPYAVDTVLPGAEGQDLFGWVAGGGKDVAVVSWYHTASPNKDAKGIDWTVPVAQVRGLATGHPSVVYGLASDHSVHHGPICTLGTFCGILPGSSTDRSLLDFFKVAVGPDGMPAVTWSDNNRVDGGPKTGVGYARQVSGPSAFTETLPSRPVAPPRAAGAPAGRGGRTTTGQLASTGLGTAVPVLALVLIVLAVGVRRRRVPSLRR